MKRNQLTLLKVKNAKPGHHADGSGLYLQVSKEGTRSWVFRFMREGRRREMGLGSVHDFSLGEARDRAREYRRMLHHGVDPIEQRLKERDRIRAEASTSETFKVAAEQYIATHQDQWRSDRHRRQWIVSLNRYAFHSLGGRPVSSIDSAVITEALAPIWTKIPVTAQRLKNRIERIVQWVKDGRPLPAPIQAKKVKHYEALPYAQDPLLVSELRNSDRMSARALEFLILTAARSDEVLHASWAEIGGDVWTIPGERMKAGKEHKVPLSKPALEVLNGLPRDDDLIFGGAHDSLRKLLKKLRPGYTVHGFRSSFRDWCGERTNYAREVIEHALAHKLPDKVEAAYRSETALGKRRQLMEAWGRYCSTPVMSGEVVALHG